MYPEIASTMYATFRWLTRLIGFSAFRSVITLSVLIFLGSTLGNTASASNPSSDQQISVLLLIDSSGSMRKNDPDRLWAAAAQTLVTVIDGDDQVAVAEFSSGAKTLSGSKGNPWLPASGREAVFDAISRVGNTGGFTDFRAGLGAAVEVFDKVPSSHRKIILMLTDGVLEPNPLDSTYAPFHLEYRLDITGKSRPERNEIYKSYIDKLAPIARRLLSDEILPDLRDRQIEVFAVSLGQAAERQFMEYLSSETSLKKTERHAFYADTPPDLVGVFTSILAYWTDRLLLRVDMGNASQATSKNIFIDHLIENPRHIAIVSKDANYFVRSEGGMDETPLDNTHPLLRLYETSSPTPGVWLYGLDSGQGNYNSAWLGSNKLAISISGLKSRYDFGEVVEPRVDFDVPANVAIKEIHDTTRVYAEIADNRVTGRTQTIQLELLEGSYQLQYSPPMPGTYDITFVAESIGSASQEFLPRRSIEHRFEVKPRFYVTPERISFGDIEPDTRLTHDIDFHYGINHAGAVKISGQAANTRFENEESNESSRPIAVTERSIAVSPGSITTAEVEFHIPKDAGWGDYEGELIFSVGPGQSDSINVSFHIPSLWEKVRLPLLLGLLLLIALLAYLAYVWGYLGSLKGVLVPVASETTVVMDSIKLARVKRGVVTKWLNWRKNRLVIAASKSDLRLDLMPPGLRVELSSYRWLGVYISNISHKDSGHSIEVFEDGFQSTALSPGRSLRLKNGSRISVGDDYVFRFEEG